MTVRACWLCGYKELDKEQRSYCTLHEKYVDGESVCPKYVSMFAMGDGLEFIRDIVNEYEE